MKSSPTAEVHEVLITVQAVLRVFGECDRGAMAKQVIDGLRSVGHIEAISFTPAQGGIQCAEVCPVCRWIHDTAFTQINTGPALISLAGVLPDIVRLVHDAHAKGLSGLSTKDDTLLQACGGYRHPCKAFDDLNRRNEYQLLFDTRKRGFISLRGALGICRNKPESIRNDRDNLGS